MLPPFLSSMAANSLTRLGEELFGAVIDKGSDKLQDIIKQATGLEIDLDKEITAEQVEIMKHNESKIRMALEDTKETNRHEEYLLTQDVEFAKLDVADVKDARLMYKEQIKSDSWFTKHFLEIFSLLILGLAGVIIWYVLSGDVPEEYMTLSMSVVEFAKAAVITVISFWVGSSHSSRLKDKALYREHRRPLAEEKEFEELYRPYERY